MQFIQKLSIFNYTSNLNPTKVKLQFLLKKTYIDHIRLHIGKNVSNEIRKIEHLHF